MALVKFNEGREGNLTRSSFSDIFENFFNDSFISDRMISRVPAVNIAESEGHYHIELAAPGLKKEDFKLDLDRNVLTISAETYSSFRQRCSYNCLILSTAASIALLVSRASVDAPRI